MQRVKVESVSQSPTQIHSENGMQRDGMMVV